MPLDHNLPDGVRPNRPLPPEFQFLVNYPDFKEMNGDEIHDYIESFFARIREKTEVLSDYGVDAEKLIAHFEPNFRNLEKKARAVDEATEKQLHAEADLGDAMYNLFMCMDRIATKAHEEKPFDLLVEEMKEFVDEWRKHMPKE